MLKLFRDRVWQPFWKWVNRPCCDKPRLEESAIGGSSLVRCANCNYTRVFPLIPF